MKIDITDIPISQRIIAKIFNNGGKLYLVGGSVRDKILGRENHDYDFCVTGFNKAEFKTIFPNADLVGNSFPVFLLDNHEVALARKEWKNGDSRKDFGIQVKDITIEEDLKRRDFTINAMAANMSTGKLIDPYGGVDDIENKTIRHVSDAFEEDELRVYRASRFAAQLGFDIHTKTEEYMRVLKPKLRNLPKERVFEEMKKAINSEFPSKFFTYLFLNNLLEVHFPEIDKLQTKSQPYEHHKEGDVFAHTMLALMVASNISDNELVRFGALVHDLGKCETPEEELPHHYGHENKVEVLERFCNRLGLPNKWRKAGKLAMKQHMRASLWQEMKPGSVVDVFEKASRNPLGIEGLEKIVRADKRARGIISKKECKLMDDFSRLGNRMFEEVNGKVVDFGDKEGEKRGQFLHQKRAEWIREERSKV